MSRICAGLLLLGALTAPLSAQAPASPHPIPPAGSYAFVNANVVPMDRDTVLRGQTVLVNAGRITAMAPGLAPPAGAQVIDATGRYLMPGIAEMHGHVPTSANPTTHHVLFLYVANGITTVRGMQGGTFHVTLRKQLEDGEIIGPRFFAAGPQLSGNSAATVDAARTQVERQKQLGFDLLKIQEGVPVDAYDEIVSSANRLGMPFGGHVPDGVGLWHALESRQGTIDHLDNFMEAVQAPDFPASVLNLLPANTAGSEQERRLRATALATKRAGIAVVPTMALWQMLYTPPDSATAAAYPELKYMPQFTIGSWFNTISSGGRIPAYQREEWIAFRQGILRALNEAEVPILMGTDSPQLFSVPGFSIHRELERMAAAGMTPYQILRSGTWNVAHHLGLLQESGSVAVGKRADLILLDANPLDNVANLTRRSGVMVAGRWLPESLIQERLRLIAQAYANAG